MEYKTAYSPLVLLFGVIYITHYVPHCSSETNVLYIGILEARDSVAHEVVQLAFDYVNKLPNLLPDTELRAQAYYVDYGVTGLGSIQAVCSVLEKSVIAIVGPRTSSGSKYTHPLCSGLHVPQITPDATDSRLSFTLGDFDYLIKMSSPDKYQTEALVDIARMFGWSKFVIIADNSDYGVRIVLLITLSERSKQILDEAATMGMTSEGWAWLVTDGTTAETDRFMDQSLTPCNETLEHLRGLIGPRPPSGRGKLFNEFMKMYNSSSTPGPYTLRVFDAILTIAYGLHAFLEEEGRAINNPAFQQVCYNETVNVWPDGQLLLEYISQVDGLGVTNHLNFTKNLYPGVTEYEIVNLQHTGWEPIGNWTELSDPKLKLDIDKVLFPGETRKVPSDIDLTDLTKLNLTVVTILERPFVVNTTVTGQSLPLSGYCIDLLRRLSEILGFTYNVYVVEDGNYGTFNLAENRWNGIVQDIVVGKAHMAVAPLTITAEREKVIDFSKPYMDLGLTILMPRDVDARDVLSFLDPFHPMLWLSLLGSYFAVSIVTSFCSFFSPFGYGGRYIQRSNKADIAFLPDRDNYSLFDSLWHTFGVWMQQGCDMTPRSLSARVVFGTWMFASMVITATYTANLAAFLTVSRLETGVHSVEDLANQEEIEYGTVSNSAPYEVFKDSQTNPYKKMFLEMDNNIERRYKAFTATAEEGIKMVRKSYGTRHRYAFIFDSAPLEYAARRKPCTITTVDLFRKFGYGLAFPKGSQLTSIFSQEILKLREGSFLDDSHSNWFKAECDIDEESELVTNQQANLWSMRGVFFVVLSSLLLASICVCGEWLIASYREVNLSKRKAKVTADKPIALSAAVQRRGKAVQSYLHKVWCTCDYDTDSEDGEDDESLAESVKPPNTPREELYSKSSDYNEDHSRAGVFRASTRRKKANREQRLSASELYIPEENKRRKESASLSIADGSHLSDNISRLSATSANESLHSGRNSFYGHTLNSPT